MSINNSIKSLNVLSILVLSFGFIYLSLSAYYMGFDRDLVYREYLLEKEYLIYFNLIYIAIFWILIFLLKCKKFLHKFSLHESFQLFIYLVLSVVTFLYKFDIYISTFIFVLLNIFGLLRICIDLLKK